MDNVFNVEEAINLLKEKIVLKDCFNNRFIGKKNGIQVFSINSSYTLKYNDFIELFETDKFMVDGDDGFYIDLEKDKEYYSFKHK